MTATIHPFTERHTDERCERHGPFRARWFYVSNEWRGGQCPVCSEEEAERRREEEEEQRRIDALSRLREKANLPRRFAESSFGDFRPPTQKARRVLDACRGYAAAFPKRAAEGAGLVLVGRPGTGKTMLATAIIREIIDKHEASAVYATAPGAMRRVRATYSRQAGESEEQAMHALTGPALLVLDECGVGGSSEHALGILQELVDGRYREGRPTIVVSNLNQRDLAAAVGDRVMDRLAEAGQTLVLNWDSHRRKRSGGGQS